MVGISCVGIGGSVEGSNALDNGDASHVAVGISMSDSSVVAHCNCENNTGTGIALGNGGRVFDCTVSKNGAGGLAGGIAGGTVIEISDCTIWSNTGAGLVLGDHAQVTRVHVNNSTTDGIVVHSLAVVRECTPDFQTAGVGIRVTGSQNRIEANNVTRNSTGILVNGTENVIIRNTASNTTANYNFVAGNRYGPIIDLTSAGTPAVTGTGNSAAGTTLSADPWANFAY
jgi:parallel beta-helix repeat protein